MATPEEKRLKKELRAKWEARQYFLRLKQRQLKEGLQSQQFWRKYDRERGVAPERPLAKLAAVEQNKEVNVTQVRETNVAQNKEGATVNDGGAAGEVHKKQQESSGNNQPKERGKAAKWLLSGAFGFGATTLFTGFAYAEFLLILAGLLKYFANSLGIIPFESGANILFADLLLGFTIFAILKGRGILPAVLLFLFIRFDYGSFLDPGFIRVVALLTIVYIAVRGVEGLAGDFHPYVWFTLIVYFYDIGGMHYIIQELGLTIPGGMLSFIQATPWWTVLGIALLDVQQLQRGQAIAGILKGLAWFYIAGSLLAASIPGVGYATPLSNVELTQEFARSRAEFEKGLPKGENPFISQLKCIGDGKFNDLQGCVENRQAESKCSQFKKEGKEQSDEYKDCIAEAKGLAPPVEIAGAVDPTQREPTKADVQKGEGFVDLIEPYDAIPLTITVKNPRQQKLKVSADCVIEQGAAIIQSAGAVPLEIEEKEKTESYTCKPIQPLAPGPARIKVGIVIQDLTTIVGLHRFLVLEPENFKNVEKELRREFFPTADAARPQGPPDPVRLDFEIGQPPSEPFIHSDPQIWATITNNGGGEIVAIKEAKIGPLHGFDVIQSQGCNLQSVDETYLVNPSFSIQGRGKEKALRYGLCEMQMTEELRTNRKPVLYYADSKIVYDYKITQEFSVTVRQQPGQGGSSGVNPS